MKCCLRIALLVLFALASSASLAISADASEYTLGIFGNANMDEAVDEQDIDYLKGVIDGSNPATNLSDANCDGLIDD